MKWLITGGGGQLGQAMAFVLSSQDCDYVLLNRSDLDITNREQILECFERLSPNIVINAAAWTNVELAESHEGEAWAVNAEGPKFLAEACAHRGAKFVQISTDYVFSGVSNLPWDEAANQSPISSYGRTKADGERLALATYPQGTYVVRTSWLYSPWGKNFVKTMVRIALKDSDSVRVVNDQIGQPTSAIDLAAQIYAMVTGELDPGIYHGTNSAQASWFELAQEIFAFLKQDVHRVEPINSREFIGLAERPAFSVLGHEHWVKEGLNPMQNWQLALYQVLPAIIIAVEIGE
jgi:dTDP-4-dehydrorhamnose reductase